MNTPREPESWSISSGNDRALTRLVRRALSHLYDYAYLQSHPLALLLDADHSLDQVTRAQKLRRLLIECLEALRPNGARGPSPSDAMRAHAILTYRYLDGLTIGQIAGRLALSRRQIYREHEKGIEAVASVLADRLRGEMRGSPHSVPSADDACADRLEAVRAEVARLRQAIRTESVSPLEVLEGVIGLLAPLQEQAPVRVQITPDPPWPQIIADRVMLRQVLLNILSHALSGGVSGHLQVALSQNHDEVTISIRGTRGQSPADAPTFQPAAQDVGLAVSQALTEAQGGRLQAIESAERWEAVLTFPAPGRKTILVIDDNADIVTLLERYVAGHAVSVVGATQPSSALTLAIELQPQLITLDVMMPGIDGWELLQQLKGTPATRDIPVVICSVLNEPRLAFAMGASDYITKPVRQDDLLAVLRRWLGPLRSVA